LQISEREQELNSILHKNNINIHKTNTVHYKKSLQSTQIGQISIKRHLWHSPTWNEPLASKPGVAGWRLKPARKGSGRLALDPSTSALCAYAQDDTLGKAEARGRLSPSKPSRSIQNLFGAVF